jgi:3-hydroxyisobutyrate dehydrogenase
METVGFIGLGRLGSGMAVNIQKAGHPMVVSDVREESTKPFLERGARLGSSPAEVASLCDVVFTSVPGPKEVNPVVLGPEGIVEGIKKDSIYIDLSSCGPDVIRAIEPKLREKGAHALDAPVFSSPKMALERKLQLFVGGDRQVFDRVRAILDTFSDDVIYAGKLGDGSICKLVHNMMGAGVFQVVAEGLTLGVKAGVPLEMLMRTGTRAATEPRRSGLEERVFRGKFEPPDFTLALYRKDVGLATELARENGVPMPLMNLAEQIMIQGMNRGWGSQDYSSVFQLQEEMASVQVRSA